MSCRSFAALCGGGVSQPITAQGLLFAEREGTAGGGEHAMPLVRALTDVAVPAAESERPRHYLLLVLQRRARQVEVQLVVAGIQLVRGHESDPEARVIVRRERDASLGVGSGGLRNRVRCSGCQATELALRGIYG